MFGRALLYIPTMVQISNSCVYRSVSNLLKLLPSSRLHDAFGNIIRFSLREKLAPYWEGGVIDAWLVFLGDLLGKDPFMYIGWKRT